MFSFLEEVSDTYTWPVNAKVPVSGGKSTTIKFEAEFNRIERERMEHLMRRDDENNLVNGDQEIIDEILVGIRARNDAGKTEEVPDDVREKLFAVIGVRAAIIRAFFASLSGEKAKN